MHTKVSAKQIEINVVAMSLLPDTQCCGLRMCRDARTFSPPLRVSDPGMHHAKCVTHVPWCMPGSLTSGFLWSQWRGKRSRHLRRMRNPQVCLSGKRPITAPAAHSTAAPSARMVPITMLHLFTTKLICPFYKWHHDICLRLTPTIFLMKLWD